MAVVFTGIKTGTQLNWIEQVTFTSNKHVLYAPLTRKRSATNSSPAPHCVRRSEAAISSLQYNGDVILCQSTAEVYTQFYISCCAVCIDFLKGRFRGVQSGGKRPSDSSPIARVCRPKKSTIGKSLVYKVSTAALNFPQFYFTQWPGCKIQRQQSTVAKKMATGTFTHHRNAGKSSKNFNPRDTMCYFSKNMAFYVPIGCVSLHLFLYGLSAVEGFC